MTQDAVLKAALHWGFDPSRIDLIAERENAVFKAYRNGKPYALRKHRPGYSDARQLWSELILCQSLSDQISVPRPLSTRDGALFADLGGIYFSALEWIEGETLASQASPNFAALGRSLAAFHLAADAWIPPKEFAPRRWNNETFLGEAPHWGRFWEHPHLDPEQKQILIHARESAAESLMRLGNDDFGIIHADANLDNVMAHEDRLTLIDFDDFGYGYRLFDLAVVAQKQMFEKDATDKYRALLQGYREMRDIDTTSLGDFILIRTLNFVGWIMSRMAMSDASEKSKRFIANAIKVAEAYQKDPKRLGHLVLD
jgi:Ser/Thr protein kinase RdoA (MazF antagonist)